MSKDTPRIVDNDRDEITVMLDGREIRGWFYANEQERRIKMLCACEFVESWYQAEESSLNRDLLYSYRGILKAVGPVRQALQIICDDIEDEGDRAYFGSTNQADTLKEITQGLEDAEWSEAIEPLPKILALDSWKLANEAYELRIESDRLKAINAELLAALKAVTDARALSGVRALVAGWNGETLPEPHVARHPPKLGARIETNCGAIYELDEVLVSARAAIRASGTRPTGEPGVTSPPAREASGPVGRDSSTHGEQN